MSKGHRHFSKKDLEKDKRYMKRCPISLIIRKMQSKPTMQFCFTSLELLLLKSQKITSIGENVEERSSLYVFGGDVNGIPIMEAEWRFLKKLMMEVRYDPAIPFLGMYPKGTL